ALPICSVPPRGGARPARRQRAVPALPAQRRRGVGSARSGAGVERSGDGRPRERLLLVLGTAVWMGVVLATVFPLATRRHFQVDELQNAYNASLLWRWDDAAAAATVHPEPFQALLGAATRGMTRTTDVLLTFRCVFVLFFVANL